MTKDKKIVLNKKFNITIDNLDLTKLILLGGYGIAAYLHHHKLKKLKEKHYIIRINMNKTYPEEGYFFSYPDDVCCESMRFLIRMQYIYINKDRQEVSINTHRFVENEPSSMSKVVLNFCPNCGKTPYFLTPEDYYSL